MDSIGHQTGQEGAKKLRYHSERVLRRGKRESERRRILALLMDAWARCDSEPDRPLSLDSLFGLLTDEWPLTDAALLARLEEATK